MLYVLCVHVTFNMQCMFAVLITIIYIYDSYMCMLCLLLLFTIICDIYVLCAHNALYVCYVSCTLFYHNYI